MHTDVKVNLIDPAVTVYNKYVSVFFGYHFYGLKTLVIYKAWQWNCLRDKLKKNSYDLGEVKPSKQMDEISG